MEELSVFVRSALAAGHSREAIKSELSQAGWPDDEIADALARYAISAFPIPVPARRAASSARDAFLYLVTFATLYIFGLALGTLLFGVVDKLLPDRVASSYSPGDDQEGLRWAIACLIVAFPIWFLLTRKHLLDYARYPERRGSPVRRWLTYLTLFFAASTMICTLIALVGGALGGDLAARFVLKCLIVMCLAGGIFGFYLWELRLGDKSSGK